MNPAKWGLCAVGTLLSLIIVQVLKLVLKLFFQVEMFHISALLGGTIHFSVVKDVWLLL